MSLDSDTDTYTVYSRERTCCSTRKVMRNGRWTRFYIHELTCLHAAQNAEFTVREQLQAHDAAVLAERQGHMSAQDTIDKLNSGGIINCNVTAADVRNSQTIYGSQSIASAKGRTHKRVSIAASRVAPLRWTSCSSRAWNSGWGSSPL